jgi:dipeptidyl aminopeptidase/acylaminoacyl peptidase
MTNFQHDVVGRNRTAVPSDQMTDMETALRAAGVQAETHLIPGSGHAFSAWHVVGPDVLEWLSGTL